jgi:hypothetical protein
MPKDKDVGRGTVSKPVLIVNVHYSPFHVAGNT